MVVIGHSEIVGKPIAFLMMGLGRDRHRFGHHMTRQVAVHSRRADAVFVAVGRPGLVTGEMLKPGAALIDIGINRVDGRTVGDADFDSCAEVAGLDHACPRRCWSRKPSPPLLKNAVLAARMQRDHYAANYAAS